MAKSEKASKPTVARKRLNGANGHANGHDPSVGKGRNSLPRKETTRRYAGNRHLAIIAGNYKSEYAQVASEMILNGAMDKEIQVALQITKTVFNLWKTQHPEFAAALDITKQISLANQRVERSVYEMSNGYSQDAIKIVITGGEVKRIKYKESVPKNINAAKFWLANRGKGWGKDPERPQSGGNLTANVTNIHFIRSMDTGRMKELRSLLKKTMTPNQGLKRLDVVDIEPEDDEDDEKK